MSKKIISLLIAGLALILGGGYILRNKGFLGGGNTPVILKYIPNQFDQFVYIHVDADVLEYLSGQSLQTTGSNLAAIAKTMEDVVMYQYASGEIYHSLLFVKDAGGFSIEKAQELGLIPMDTGYTNKNLADQVVVYGDVASLAYLDQYAGEYIADNKDFAGWIEQLSAYNIGFISKPVADSQAMSNPIVAQFAKKLKYTQVLTKIGKQTAGNVRLQFDSEVFPLIADDFVPTLTKNAAEKSTMVIEFQHLLDMFGVNKESFTSLASMGIGQMQPALGSQITTQQYEDIYTLFNAPLLLEIQPSPSLVGMSMRLTFSTGGLYTLISPAAPIIAGLLSTIVGSGNITTEQGSGEIMFSMTMPMLGEVGTGENNSGGLLNNVPGITLRQSLQGDILTLFDADWNTKKALSFGTLPKHTLAVFQTQGDQINSMIGLPFAGNAEGSGSQTISQGSLSIDGRNALVLQFKN